MSALPVSADVVVVGGGIIGLTTALELARAGARVCVLDRGLPGREASWAGGGILSPLPPDQSVPEIQDLLDESLARYPAYCTELHEATGVDPEYWVCGARVYGAAGERWFPEVAQIRNPRLLQALLLALRQQGVTIHPYVPATGWAKAAGRLAGVTTPFGTVACRQAVLAAGAWSGQVAGISVQPIKGQMLLLQDQGDAPAHIVMDEHAYLVPRRGGGVVVGSTLESVGFDTSPTAAARSALIGHAARLWPGSDRWSAQHHWVGLRPGGNGIKPLIGPVSGLDGLFVNTAHFRLGITLSLASAARVRRMLAEQATAGAS